LAIIFFVLLLLGCPIFSLIGLLSFLYFWLSGQTFFIYALPQTFIAGIDSFIIMAMPLFVFMGETISRGGIVDDLAELANYFVGRFRGGLAYTNILVSTAFAGVSGAATADMAALGSTLVPAMEKSGFDKEFSAAVTAASALQGPLIPPSIPAVIIAGLAGISVGAVFLAGAIPGLLLGLGCIIVTFIQSRRRNYPIYKTKFSFKYLIRMIWKNLLSLFTIVIVIGGIIFGVFTATEAAAVACVYALFLTFIVKKNPINKLPEILKNTILTTSKVYILLGVIQLFSLVLSFERVPQLLGNWIIRSDLNTFLILLILNVFLIFWGMFMAMTAALILLVPILFPILEQIGISPIHMATLFVFNHMIGLISPPFGVGLYILVGVTKVDFFKLVKELLPFYITIIGVLLLITYTPELCLFLPRLFGFIN